MKLERNNKYNKRKTLGLAVILASGIILSACNNIEGEVVNPTPTEIVEVTPTPMITPIPTIEPTATPMPELSYEEEIELLGIKEPNELKKISWIDVFEYTINGQKKIMFALISAYPNENGGHNVYEWFSGTKKVMFTLDYDIYESGRTTRSRDCENITIVNEALNGATIDQGYFLYYLPEHYKELGIDGIDPEIIKFIHPNMNNNKATDEFINTMMTNLEIADMYLALVPKQYRVTAAELDPNNLVEEGKVLVK